MRLRRAKLRLAVWLVCEKGRALLGFQPFGAIRNVHLGCLSLSFSLSPKGKTGAGRWTSACEG